MDHMQTIMERLHALEERNQQLESALMETRQALGVSEAARHAQVEVVSTHAPREPKIALPDKFNGDRKNFRGFMAQVEILFMSNALRYPTDDAKIGLIGSLMTGNALKWITPMLEKKEVYASTMASYAAFKKAFAEAFGETDAVTVAENQLERLRQGKYPASKYAMEFRRIASDLAWNDAALIRQFKKGLNEEIKDLLLHHDDPTSLEDMITLAIRCDNRLFERQQERKSFGSYPRSSTQHVSATHNSKSTTDVVPMDISAVSRSPLTEEQKNYRRMNNLCAYCGAKGHFVKNCPQVKPRSTTENSGNVPHQ